MYVCVPIPDVRDESSARYCHAEPRDPVDDDQPRVPAADVLPCCPTGERLFYNENQFLVT